MTEWHWASPLASPDMAGRTPPCAGHAGLAALDGQGEHLCRVCLNCGYGWPEACAGRDAALSRVPPAVWAGLFSLAGGLACAGAGSLLSVLLGGAALVVMWLAVTVVISVAAATGCVAVAGTRAAVAPAERLAPARWR
jgi:hypothetical protein